jgi:hypothetical protein
MGISDGSVEISGIWDSTARTTLFQASAHRAIPDFSPTVGTANTLLDHHEKYKNPVSMG